MTDSKNRFILVCVDYATKYPEAIALRDQEASTVANALISLLVYFLGWEYLKKC